MFFEPLGSHSPVRRLNLPSFHSVGMLWPTATLFRAGEPPHWFTSAVTSCAGPSTAVGGEQRRHSRKRSSIAIDQHRSKLLIIRYHLEFIDS